MDKELYVVAGPNAAGKTSGVKGRIPENIPMINGDLIHFAMFHTHVSSPASSEQAKDEAQKKIKDLVEKKASFGFETNLATTEDWKYLKDLQSLGYKVNVLFVSVNDTNTLQERIKLRVASGEAHYVDPNTVVNRYNNGLKLLDHYFNVPDNLQIIDNSDGTMIVLKAEKGNIKFKADLLPKWVATNLGSRLHPDEGPKNREVRQMDSKEDVLSRYREMQKPKAAENSDNKDDDDDDEPEKKVRKGPRL